MRRSSREYEKFDRTIRQIVQVSHSAIKSQLDAEKDARKRKKSSKSIASRAATSGRITNQKPTTPQACK